MISIEPTPSVRAFRSDAPAGLDAILFRCLEKQARDRYRDVAEFAVALLPFAPRRARASVDRISGTLGGGGSAERDLPSPSSHGFPATGTLPAVGLTTPGATRVKKSVMGAIVIGAVAIGAIAAVAGLLPKSTDGREGPPPTTRSTDHAAAAAAPAGPVYPSALGTTVVDSSPPNEPDASAPAPATVAVVPPAEHRHPKEDAPPSLVPVNSLPAAAVPAPTTPARPNCDPPYYSDKQGNRIFKQECPL